MAEAEEDHTSPEVATEAAQAVVALVVLEVVTEEDMGLHKASKESSPKVIERPLLFFENFVKL